MSAQATWEQTIAKPESQPQPAGGGSGCLLQIHPLDVSGQLIELGDGQVMVGRDDACQLSISDASVSRQHAVIARMPDGFEVTDMGSTNGTFVNEQRIQSSVLCPGDRLQFGGFIYKFLSSNHIELQYHEAVYSMMTRDGLTGTLNKRFFLDMIGREFNKSMHRGSPLCLILMDIDHFKGVNDTHGHLAGDEVLKELGRRVGGVVAEHDVFARYGGEEFAILISGVEVSDAVDVAERCRQAVLADVFPTSVGPLPITISVGVAAFAGLSNPKSHDDLIQAADAKLYEAKRGGRNRVCV